MLQKENTQSHKRHQNIYKKKTQLIYRKIKLNKDSEPFNSVIIMLAIL